MKKVLSLVIAIGATVTLVTAAQAQDAKAGEKKASMCLGCHNMPGYQASFPEVYKVPMISGQGAKYIVSALAAYKKGERKHPTMKAIAASLTEQDMADLAAFYAGEPGAAPPEAAAAAPAAVTKLLEKGNCGSCHGTNLSKPIDPSYPKLAGQHADYLYFALKAYQTERNPQVGRGNAIMMGLAKPYSHAELKALAGYIASLPGELRTVPEPRFR